MRYPDLASNAWPHTAGKIDFETKPNGLQMCYSCLPHLVEARVLVRVGNVDRLFGGEALARDALIGGDTDLHRPLNETKRNGAPTVAFRPIPHGQRCDVCRPPVSQACLHRDELVLLPVHKEDRRAVRPTKEMRTCTN